MTLRYAQLTPAHKFMAAERLDEVLGSDYTNYKEE